MFVKIVLNLPWIKMSVDLCMEDGIASVDMLRGVCWFSLFLFS